jgi:hypothetical protein
MYVVPDAESPIERAVKLIPELERQPEFETERAWREQDSRLDIKQMTVSGVSGSIVAPFLERSLRAKQLDSARRALDYIEGLFENPEPEARVWAEHMIEYRVFRPTLATTARGLLGPRSLDHLRSLEKLWAPWSPIVDVLNMLFAKVAVSASSRYPSLKSSGSPVVNSAGCAFHYAYSFMYEPASQRYEDMVLEFAAGHSDLAAMHLPPDQRAESVTYEIERGTGHLLAPRLGPIPLPDKRTYAYYEAVLDAANQATSHTWRHLNEVLPLLAIPYDVGDADE